MQYTVDYFIKKFEAIPEELWCMGAFHDGEKSCALGHCDKNHSGFSVFGINQEGESLNQLFLNILDDTSFFVNDGFCEKYKQPTPKQRILAALYDIKALQHCEVRDVVDPAEVEKVKILIKYVAVPETISEMETVLN